MEEQGHSGREQILQVTQIWKNRVKVDLRETFNRTVQEPHKSDVGAGYWVKCGADEF